MQKSSSCARDDWASPSLGAWYAAAPHASAPYPSSPSRSRFFAEWSPPTNRAEPLHNWRPPALRVETFFGWDAPRLDRRQIRGKLPRKDALLCLRRAALGRVRARLPPVTQGPLGHANRSPILTKSHNAATLSPSRPPRPKHPPEPSLRKHRPSKPPSLATAPLPPPSRPPSAPSSALASWRSSPRTASTRC